MDKKREVYLDKYSVEILQNFKAYVVAGKSEYEAAELSGCSLYELRLMKGWAEAREGARELMAERAHAGQLVLLQKMLVGGFSRTQIAAATGLRWLQITRRDLEFRKLIGEESYTVFYNAEKERRNSRQDDTPDFGKIRVKRAIEKHT